MQIEVWWFLAFGLALSGIRAVQRIAVALIERGNRRPALADAEMSERIERIEQAVEGMSLEVERIGEGQRYLTRVLETRPLPAADGVRPAIAPALSPVATAVTPR